MDFSSFTRLTHGTAIYPEAGEGTLRGLVYVSLGLVGESCEVREKQLTADTGGLVAELGDVAWYLARLHTELGQDVDRLDMHSLEPAPDLLVAAGRVAELAKKALRDDNGALTSQRKDAFVAGLRDAVRAWVALCAIEGITVSTVLSANYDKLTSRRARGTLVGSGDDR